MMGLSPGCYIPSFVEIDLSVPEKIFDWFLPYIGVAAILVMLYNIWAWWPFWSSTSIIASDFHFLVPESFHAKFGSDRHSSF